MRKLITLSTLIITLTFFLTSCAMLRGPKADPKYRTHQEIISIPDKTKDEIYIKANGWFVENFTSAESVIEFQDKEDGKVMGKYTFEYSEKGYLYRIKQVVDIDVKDEKVKVRMTDPYYALVGGTGNYYILETTKALNEVRKTWFILIDDLKDYLDKDTDW